jgi:hypothetical protein
MKCASRLEGLGLLEPCTATPRGHTQVCRCRQAHCNHYMVDPTTRIPAYQRWHVNTVQVTANPGPGTSLVELVAATSRRPFQLQQKTPSGTKKHPSDMAPHRSAPAADALRFAVGATSLMAGCGILKSRYTTPEPWLALTHCAGVVLTNKRNEPLHTSYTSTRSQEGADSSTDTSTRKEHGMDHKTSCFQPSVFSATCQSAPDQHTVQDSTKPHVIL